MSWTFWGSNFRW